MTFYWDVYTPYLKTLYSSINAFLDIENEIVNFIEKDMKCALVGDFNAKTTVLEDFNIFIFANSRVLDLHISESFPPKLFGHRNLQDCVYLKVDIQNVCTLKQPNSALL
jgi:hypothetical protein